MSNLEIIESETLVSVVVVTYNSAAYVIETLESIKEQTYENIELIISDDCSTDDTVKICKEWLKENSSRFVRTELVTSPKNSGIAPNFNRGIAVAKGEWIKTIAGDDALLPNTIEAYINHIMQNSDTRVIHSDIAIYKDVFKESQRLPAKPTSTYTINKPNIEAQEQFQLLLRRCQIWAATVMIKKEVYDQVGHFDESLPMWEDRPMWLKITGSGIKLTYLNIIGAKYRISSNSIQTKGAQTKLYSKFDLDVNKEFYKRYLHFLPLPERVKKKIKIKRNLLLEKYGLNRRNKLIIAFVATTNLLLNTLIKDKG
ncbi:glycosyltransferase [Pontibacter korlensis]|uniref:glycosyltransferase family 2 protein n=1 Tax=Pontibacter korlensis TaxID=400092 RepID=UPI000698E83D|nr:glycosyltransferase [Pontibacter korlensis]